MNSLIMQLGAVVSAAIEAAATAAVQSNNSPSNQQSYSSTSSSSSSSSLLSSSSSDSSSPKASRPENSSPTPHRTDGVSSSVNHYNPTTTTTSSIVTTALIGDGGTIFTATSEGGGVGGGFTVRPVTITTSASIVDGNPRVQVQARVSQSPGNSETLLGSPTGSFKIIKSLDGPDINCSVFGPTTLTSSHQLPHQTLSIASTQPCAPVSSSPGSPYLSNSVVRSDPKMMNLPVSAICSEPIAVLKQSTGDSRRSNNCSTNNNVLVIVKDSVVSPNKIGRNDVISDSREKMAGISLSSPTTIMRSEKLSPAATVPAVTEWGEGVLLVQKTNGLQSQYNPNTSRPTVLMSPRHVGNFSSVMNTSVKSPTTGPSSPATKMTSPSVALSIVLQDHNYVSIPRMQSPLSPRLATSSPLGSPVSTLSLTSSYCVNSSASNGNGVFHQHHLSNNSYGATIYGRGLSPVVGGSANKNITISKKIKSRRPQDTLDGTTTPKTTRVRRTDSGNSGGRGRGRGRGRGNNNNTFRSGGLGAISSANVQHHPQTTINVADMHVFPSTYKQKHGGGCGESPPTSDLRIFGDAENTMQSYEGGRTRNDSVSTKSASEDEDEIISGFDEREKPSSTSGRKLGRDKGEKRSTSISSAMDDYGYNKGVSGAPNNDSTHVSPPPPPTDDSITRCICDFLHDDGFMICCDKCWTWQHVDCMGIDRRDIPETYMCEKCHPRWVSRIRARGIQARKKDLLDKGVTTEQINDTSASIMKAVDATVMGGTGQESQLENHSTGAISPNKMPPAKLKKRGRPSLSNGGGQQLGQSDSDGELMIVTTPNGKRARKFSGRSKQNSSKNDLTLRKIGKKGKFTTDGATRVKRSYTRRHTVPAVSATLDFQEDSTVPSSSKLASTSPSELSQYPTDFSRPPSSKATLENAAGYTDELSKESLEDADAITNGNHSMDLSSSRLENAIPDGGNDGSVGLTNESRRKARKQTFRAIPNGDLSPPHIISSGRTEDGSKPQQLQNLQSDSQPRSPVFDKTIGGNLRRSSSSSMSSPESAYSGGSVSPNIGISIPVYSCPYSNSPYLDKYEEAEDSICSYTQELRAKLLKHHSLDVITVPDFEIAEGNAKRWKLGITSLEGGKKLKTLLAGCRLLPNQAVIELVGKYQMSNGFVPTRKSHTNNPNNIQPEPFAFFHQVHKNGMCISIDLRKYGNEARFVRRSCKANAEIRHVAGKGTLHAYIVTTQAVEVDEEITIPHEFQTITKSQNHEYFIVPPALPCGCLDASTCTVRMIEPSKSPIGLSSEAYYNQRKNGALTSPTLESPEPKERKKRLSSRRTSSLDKDLVPLHQQDTGDNQNISSPMQATVTKSTPDPASPVDSVPQGPSTPDESTATTPVSQPVKERIPRTTRSITASVNSAAANVEDVPAQPITSTPSRRSRAESSSGAGRHRNKSGNDSKTLTTLAETQGTSNPQDLGAHDSSKPMSREERKLQSVLKLIERMENNQRKKENRQTQKKEKVKDPSTKDDDHDDENHSDSSVQTPTNKSVKFAPASSSSTQAKRKGRRRGRSGSHGGGGSRSTSPRKPQLISQRSSGSGGDMRSTSTESDVNSADESKMPSDVTSGAGIPDAADSNFRLPKTKKLMMTEWYRSNSPTPSSSPSGVADSSLIPQQYMRRSLTSPSSVTAPNNAPSFNPSTSNNSLDNASAKKRWLRQAISEETDASSPSSRPLSPLATGDCVAPLKKRRFARSSISSEISNTPPSTPTNHVDGHNSEPEHDLENEELTISATYEGGNSKRIQNRTLSVSEISSAEDEEMDAEDVEKSTTDVELKVENSENTDMNLATHVEDEKGVAQDSVEEAIEKHESDMEIEEEKLPKDIDEPTKGKEKKERSSGGKKKKRHHHHHHHGRKKKEEKLNDRSKDNQEDIKLDAPSTLDLPPVEEKKATPETGIICDTVVSDKSSSPVSRSPTRKSRWDQVEAKEPIVSSPCTSPVKGTSITEPIVLDYIRDKSISQLKLNLNSSVEISRSTLLSKLARTAAADASLEEIKTTNLPTVPSISETSRLDIPCTEKSENSPNESHLHRTLLEEHNATTPTKRKLSILEYRQRQREGRSISDDGSVSSGKGNATASSKESAFVTNDASTMESRKDTESLSSASSLEDVSEPIGSVRLSWNSPRLTPTLAEKKLEDKSKILAAPTEIRKADGTSTADEVKQTSTSTSYSRSKGTQDRYKEKSRRSSSGTSYSSRNSSSSSISFSGTPHRLSVPTAGALKQSGMPPLPPNHLSNMAAAYTKSNTTSNGPVKSSKSYKDRDKSGSAPNGYSPSSNSASASKTHGGGSYHYSNSSRSQSGHSSSSTSPRGSSVSKPPASNSTSSSSTSSNAIIGGIPVNNLIPPPPPPTNQPGPAFSGRLFNKKFYPPS